MARKEIPIAEAARAVPHSEGGMRRLERLGIVKPVRDPWGRRLFGEDDIQAARKYLSSRGRQSSAA